MKMKKDERIDSSAISAASVEVKKDWNRCLERLRMLELGNLEGFFYVLYTHCGYVGTIPT